ncbi:glycosyl transferase [Desulfosarcina widdelii]|uniref:Glycosyl transferase n=1 Tax=Desulfosarcina widdelii TaxID=947919 RepID=A0A5K7YXB8_9BACT|nr:glycosyltransferase [Desulfosarcina widdelii]BBO72980.1 glycosyl transferase [Desulfosarcina widdelii]
MKKKEKKIWIAWERHRRTLELARDFDCKLYIINYSKNRLLRYVLSIKRTLIILIQNKPNILFVQNPSIILSLIAVMLKKIFKYRLVVDAHNAAIVPDDNFLKNFYQLYQFVHKKATITIVTNRYLAKIINKNGGTSFVLPDKIPEILNIEDNKKENSVYNFVFVCTYGNDEPFKAVFRAGRLISKNYNIYVTGNYKKVDYSFLENLSKNVILTGFLPEIKYWKLLLSSDCIIDLTFRKDCLVCGAYEGIACNKPLILSNSKINKETFYKGTIFTENDANSISNSIKQFISKKTLLEKEVIDLHYEMKRNWNFNFLKLKYKLDSY